MGYWGYYLFWILLWQVLDNPYLLIGVVVFLLFRKFIPDPWIWLKTAGKIRSLRGQIEINPANATARRDLARIYLERRRPRAALALLEEAKSRYAEDPELLYLCGVAKLRSGNAAGAVDDLLGAIHIDPRTAFGEPYLVVGDALTELGRLEDARDAYDHYVSMSSSSIEGWLKMAKAHRRLGEKSEAEKAMDELFRTWRQLPGYARRKQWGWWLRALPAKLIG
jgi:tetratricopeptide (TPR) repeat protein